MGSTVEFMVYSAVSIALPVMPAFTAIALRVVVSVIVGLLLAEYLVFSIVGALPSVV
jgi:hypothetical protein